MPRLWRPLFLIGLLATAGYFLIPSATAQSVSYDVFGFVMVAAIVAGVLIHRPQRWGVWVLLAIGQALFLAGDVVWGIYDQFLHIDPFPSKADVLYLLGYPFVGAALLMLLRHRSPGQDRRGLLDATVISVGLGLLAWVFLIRPYADDHTLALSEQVVAIAYPVMDVLLVAVAARLALVAGTRTPSFYLLMGGLVVMLGADAAYGYGELSGAFDTSTGSLVDGAYLLPYLLIGVAALHPSMRRLSEHDPLPQGRLTWYRLALLGAASMTAPVALAVQAARNEPIDVPVIVTGSALLFLLVLARLAGLFREVEANAEELEFQGAALRTALAELRETENDRRQLLDRILSASDQERMRLAMDLHDGPIQRLATIRYGLERARLHLERGRTESADELLRDVERQVSVETHALRRLMAELRPPALDESGLVGAVRDQVVGFERKTGVECDLQADVEGRLDPELETVLYRVIQEALTNVAKHAKAQHVEVKIRSEAGAVELEVVDDGMGFERGDAGEKARNGHLGLIAMRERVQMAGGTWAVDSVPNEGPRVQVRFEKAGV